MKIFISIDMEGIGGVVSGTQTTEDGREYARFTKLMTNELNAAISGVVEAGATTIVVADSHGSGENIIIEDLPSNVILVRGLTRPLCMMQGIESDKFDGAIFIGYHSSANFENGGVLQHTIHGRLFTEVLVNGKTVSESVLNAGIASEFGVPIIMVSGDDALQQELKSHPAFQDIEYACVKKKPTDICQQVVIPLPILVNSSVKKPQQLLKKSKPSKPMTLEPILFLLSSSNVNFTRNF